MIAQDEASLVGGSIVVCHHLNARILVARTTIKQENEKYTHCFQAVCVCVCVSDSFSFFTTDTFKMEWLNASTVALFWVPFSTWLH